MGDVGPHLISQPSAHSAQEGRRGNSMEDLSLSARGFELGGMISAGKLKTNVDVANWLSLNVARGQR